MLHCKITYRTRLGQTVEKWFSTDQMEERLKYLEEDERKTRELAPTDSGDVRYNYCAEADSIRETLRRLKSGGFVEKR